MRKRSDRDGGRSGRRHFFLLAPLPPRPRIVADRRRGAGAAARSPARITSTARDPTASGDRQAIAAAAARAGLKFVILTDHGDGTRVPDAPAYIAGVLCIDAVEISTNGGHYVALGLGAGTVSARRRAGRRRRGCRRGSAGSASRRTRTRAGRSSPGRDWTLPFDGIEWLNADSEWRNETRAAPRARGVRLLRCGPARRSRRSSIDRYRTLAHWDALTSTTAGVLRIAGHDAHGGIGRSAEYRGTGQSGWLPGVPSYEASFRSFSTRVVLESGLTGDASADAAMLLAAIRRGRMFTTIDAIAAPALLDFHAVRGAARASMGDAVAARSRVLQRECRGALGGSDCAPA